MSDIVRQGAYGAMNQPMTVSNNTAQKGHMESGFITPQQARYQAEQAETRRLTEQQIARLGGPQVWDAMNAHADETWSEEKRGAWNNIFTNGSTQDRQRALDQFKREFFEARLKREPTGQGAPVRYAR